MHNWDFTPRPVCRKSFAILSLQQDFNCIPVRCAHPPPGIHLSHSVLTPSLVLRPHPISYVLRAQSILGTPFSPPPPPPSQLSEKAKIWNHVEELKEFTRLRDQLLQMRCFISVCRFAKLSQMTLDMGKFHDNYESKLFSMQLLSSLGSKKI